MNKRNKKGLWVKYHGFSDLAGDQFDIARRQRHRRVGHDLGLDGAQTSGGAGLNEAVQHHVQQVGDLKGTRDAQPPLPTSTAEEGW